MRTYRITFSSLTHSYSEIVNLDDDCEATCLYIPGEYSGESLKDVVGHLEGLSQSEECPPVFHTEAIIRVSVEDLTPLEDLPVMPKPMEDCLL